MCYLLLYNCECYNLLFISRLTPDSRAWKLIVGHRPGSGYPTSRSTEILIIRDDGENCVDHKMSGIY